MEMTPNMKRLLDAVNAGTVLVAALVQGKVKNYIVKRGSIYGEMFTLLPITHAKRMAAAGLISMVEHHANDRHFITFQRS